ncbi:MAG: LysE family translocator [Lachnospiraceae bacterium]|nr:LysE family translocator [Lachnospiraceae bacterium]MDE7203177.1 LysE family translocator [Lachnospiraceae bacterium]
MPFELIGKGLLTGLIFGVPAGAIGALTIQRTLEKGFLYGFLTGLGSSAADILYAMIGLLGITMITDFLNRYEKVCSACGAVLIAVYGVMICRRKAGMNQNGTIKGTTYMSGFLSAFAIAIMNPATILSFLVAFETVGLIGEYSIREGLQIVSGILLGTGTWWAVLSGVVYKFKSKVTDKIYVRMNLLLGCLLIGFAAIVFIRTCVV